MIEVYNTREVAFYNDSRYVKYHHPEEDVCEREIIGKGDNEFEATYNAILNYIKINS